MKSPVTIIRECGLTAVEQFSIPPRRERRLRIPGPYNEGATGTWLRASVAGAAIWRHQALALQAILRGDNVVVSTSTASGKSLVFFTPMMRELLEGTGKVMILYPQKALGGDQLQRIRADLALAGLDPELVGEINGDVKHGRDEILERSSVILATEDVVHCWMLGHLESLSIRRFLSSLRFLVIDEAHVLEGVFGTNSAFFLRRLISARWALAQEAGQTAPLQIIAATATIVNAAEHLRLLTGQKFTEIGEAENGAPFHGLKLMHVEGPEHGQAAERMFAEICSAVAERIAPNAFIALADSRQGIERVSHFVDREDVLPYRGGYEGHDRRAIEQALRAGKLAGVVSTSALELGIDIPQFVIGLNMGLTQTRKSMRQRIGRIGRRSSGVFIVVAPRNAFSRLGGSFREYFEAEVEPSHLYLDNRQIQFQAASCLVRELEALPA